jgi:hypothetical protein
MNDDFLDAMASEDHVDRDSLLSDIVKHLLDVARRFVIVFHGPG